MPYIRLLVAKGWQLPDGGQEALEKALRLAVRNTLETSGEAVVDTGRATLDREVFCFVVVHAAHGPWAANPMLHAQQIGQAVEAQINIAGLRGKARIFLLRHENSGFYPGSSGSES